MNHSSRHFTTKMAVVHMAHNHIKYISPAPHNTTCMWFELCCLDISMSHSHPLSCILQFIFNMPYNLVFFFFFSLIFDCNSFQDYRLLTGRLRGDALWFLIMQFSVTTFQSMFGEILGLVQAGWIKKADAQLHYIMWFDPWQ